MYRRRASEKQIKSRDSGACECIGTIGGKKVRHTHVLAAQFNATYVRISLSVLPQAHHLVPEPVNTAHQSSIPAYITLRLSFYSTFIVSPDTIHTAAPIMPIPSECLARHPFNSSTWKFLSAVGASAT